MRLRSLVATFGALSLLLISIAAAVTYKQMDAVARTQKPPAMVERLALTALQLTAVAVGFTSAPDRLHQEALRRAGHALADATEIASTSGSFASDEMARELDALNARIHAVAERLCDAGGPDQPCAASDETTPTSGASGELLRISDRIAAIAEPTIALRDAQGRSALRRAGAVLMILFVGMSVMALAFWSLMAQRILHPLARLRDGFERVGVGDLDHRIAIATRDECGEIALSFNRMVADLKRVIASRDKLRDENARRAALEEDLRARNAQLVEMNLELDAFARIAAHDLRAPLRGVKALAEWMAEDLDETSHPDMLSHLTLMLGRISRLDALVDSLQRYAEIGRATHAVEPFQAAKFVRWLTRKIDPDCHHDIRFEGDEETIFVHRAPVEMALTELLGNAIKHHDGPRAAVSIAMRIEHDHAVFTVTDDGPGVPTDLQERIFEMFQTLRPRDDVEGAGMGLALVQKAARIYKGSLRVDSPVHDGRGCAFALSWPVRKMQA